MLHTLTRNSRDGKIFYVVPKIIFLCYLNAYSQVNGVCSYMVAWVKVATQSGDRKIKGTNAQSVVASDTTTQANRKYL